MTMSTSSGYPVVLTADPLLMSAPRLLFDGMVLGSQTTVPFWPLACRLLAPPRRARLPRAEVAPLGLRRIEAALLGDGFTEEELVLAHPAGLARVIGPRTRLVAISSGEPLGRGMNSATMTAIAGGEIISARLFRDTLAHVRRQIAQRAPNARIVVGGPGAWQLTGDDAARRNLGISHVVTGNADGNAGTLFRAVLEDPACPVVLSGQSASAPPAICGPSLMGAIEISRGCGWGCRFCSMATEPMRDLPSSVILSDARLNVAAGQRDLVLLSEDFFRYGAEGPRVRPAALIDLLEQLRAPGDVGLIQVDHAGISSIAQTPDADLRRIQECLAGDTGWRTPWVNVGVESASADLLRRHGCQAKLGAFAGTWPETAAEQMQRLCDAGFFPLASLVMDLPGETPDDIENTRHWVQRVAHLPLAVFPVLHAPLEPGACAPRMTAAHWRLVQSCYRVNFRTVPAMVWNSHAAAGTGLPLRLLMQALGRAQATLWRALFAWHRHRAADASA